MIPTNKTVSRTWAVPPNLLRWLMCLTLVIVQMSVSVQESTACCYDSIEVQDEAEDEAEEEADDEEEEEEAINNPWRIDPRKFIAAKKFQIKQLFLTDVEVINKACDLEPKQKLKLSIAAKGAAEKQLLAWIKRTDKQVGQMGLNLALKKAGAKGKPGIEIKDADKIDAQIMQFIGLNQFGGSIRTKAPTEGKFWKKTVASVLSDTQASKLRAFRDARKEAKRKSVIAYTLESLAFELSLTEEQKTELADILIPAAKDHVVLESVQTHYEPYLLRYYASKVSKNKMKKLLSASQLQQWKIYVAPAKNFGPMFDAAQDEDEAEKVAPQQMGVAVLVEMVGDMADGIEEIVEHLIEFTKRN